MFILYLWCFAVFCFFGVLMKCKLCVILLPVANALHVQPITIQHSLLSHFLKLRLIPEKLVTLYHEPGKLIVLTGLVQQLINPFS